MINVMPGSSIEKTDKKTINKLMLRKEPSTIKFKVSKELTNARKTKIRSDSKINTLKSFSEL